MITAFVITAIVTANQFQGTWNGTISYRNSPWPAAIDVDSKGAVHISLPQLLYYHQPAKSKLEKDTFTVDFPFGVGSIPLKLDRSALKGLHPLGKDKLTLTFSKSSAPNPVRTREISFKNGDLTFRGTLYLPTKAKKHPGAVQIHGAGVQGRSSWAYTGSAYYLASQGVAILTYEKRAYSEVYPDLKDLASDATAAFKFLEKQPEIDTSKLGLTGGSQAGWIMSEIAPQLNVAWIIGTSLPANTPGENEFWVQKMRASRSLKASREQLMMLDTYLRLFFYSARTGRLFDELVNEGQSISEEPWAKFVELPTEPSHMGWWQRNMDYGSDQLWQQLKSPVLALYGSEDVYVDPFGDPARLRAISPKFKTATLPQADHRLEIPMGEVNGKWQWPQMSPLYFQNIEQFLKSEKITK